MLGVKPDPEMWRRINLAFLGGKPDQSAATVIVTMISGMSQMLIQGGICRDEHQARAHLAAMLISPDDLPGRPGALMRQLKNELLRLDDGKWIS